MGFIKKEWTDRVSEYPNRRTLTKLDGSSEDVFVARNEGNIGTEGDAFSAENMNDLEERIAEGFQDINNKAESINVYVGDDKKLHFTDSEGADTVIPFSNNRKYVTYRTGSNDGEDATIDIYIYGDILCISRGYREEAYTDIVGLATLSYEMPNWILTFKKTVTVNDITYQAGSSISWPYEEVKEFELVLIE